MEKIKINLDCTTLNKLCDDMATFKFTKENGAINKNGFLNTLLKNYFPIYDSEASKYIDLYTKIINNHIGNEKLANEIINDLISSNEYFSFNKSSALESSISFKPSNYNLNLLRIIDNKYLNYQSISSFFRNMIEHYLSLPQYKREQIIYLETYTIIKEAIEGNYKIILHLNDKQNELLPYKIVTSKEEIYNYLVCLSKNEKSTTMFSIHLYKIKYVYLVNQKFLFTKDEILKLDKAITHGAQFPYYNDEETIIKLTPAGIKLYNKKYLNRPTPYKIENDTYYFNCSFAQISLYFFSFGKEALILEPSSLKSYFKSRYLEALNIYE